MTEQKITKRYSIALRQKAIAEIESGQYTKSQAAKLYDVCLSTIHRWLKHSGKVKLLNKVIKIQMPNEIDKIKKLEQEKKALESAFAQAQLKIINLESTLEVLEEEYQIDFKKNFDIELSKKRSKRTSSNKGRTRSDSSVS